MEKGVRLGYERGTYTSPNLERTGRYHGQRMKAQLRRALRDMRHLDAIPPPRGLLLASFQPVHNVMLELRVEGALEAPWGWRRALLFPDGEKLLPLIAVFTPPLLRVLREGGRAPAYFMTLVARRGLGGVRLEAWFMEPLMTLEKAITRKNLRVLGQGYFTHTVLEYPHPSRTGGNLRVTLAGRHATVALWSETRHKGKLILEKRLMG